MNTPTTGTETATHQPNARVVNRIERTEKQNHNKYSAHE